jgi:hypothetical protein
MHFLTIQNLLCPKQYINILIFKMDEYVIVRIFTKKYSVLKNNGIIVLKS